MKTITIFLITYLAVFSDFTYAQTGAGNGGGEKGQFIEKRDQITEWLQKNVLLGLVESKLVLKTITGAELLKRYLDAVAAVDEKIDFNHDVIAYGNSIQICENKPEEKLIHCNIDEWNSASALVKYMIVFHEFLGIALIETNDESEYSRFTISPKIMKFVQTNESYELNMDAILPDLNDHDLSSSYFINKAYLEIITGEGQRTPQTNALNPVIRQIRFNEDKTKVYLLGVNKGDDGDKVYFLDLKPINYLYKQTFYFELNGFIYIIVQDEDSAAIEIIEPVSCDDSGDPCKPVPLNSINSSSTFRTGKFKYVRKLIDPFPTSDNPPQKFLAPGRTYEVYNGYSSEREITKYIFNQDLTKVFYPSTGKIYPLIKKTYQEKPCVAIEEMGITFCQSHFVDRPKCFLRSEGPESDWSWCHDIRMANGPLAAFPSEPQMPIANGIYEVPQYGHSNSIRIQFNQDLTKIAYNENRFDEYSPTVVIPLQIQSMDGTKCFEINSRKYCLSFSSKVLQNETASLNENEVIRYSRISPTAFPTLSETIARSDWIYSGNNRTFQFSANFKKVRISEGTDDSPFILPLSPEHVDGRNCYRVVQDPDFYHHISSYLYLFCQPYDANQLLIMQIDAGENTYTYFGKKVANTVPLPDKMVNFLNGGSYAFHVEEGKKVVIKFNDDLSKVKTGDGSEHITWVEKNVLCFVYNGIKVTIAQIEARVQIDATAFGQPYSGIGYVDLIKNK